MSNIYKSGEDFLNKKYKELFFSDIVESIKDKNDTRDEALRKYLKLLEETHNNVYSSKRESDRNLLKRLYYSKYIIKEEDITESYWNFLNQQYIAGTGYELNEELKQEHIETIIKDQKASLDAWLDYLSCEDSKFYPMWAKYWAFQGMLTIGTYDNKNEIYKKRTKDTVAPFIELNQEVLAKCIDYIVKYVEYNQVSEKELEQIITNGNFFKLYTVLISKFKETTYDKESIDGIWVKYEQGDNYKPLYNSLQGYATGWCTAGEDTCKSQIRDGDFYVYYTYDKEGNPKIPRIAIRMNGKNRIAEIRGVADNQNLESHLEDILEEKLKEFPDRDEYKQRIEDQKTLTYIYRKYKNNIELTKEDLEFLYETKTIISKFGYQDDPRKKEILETRNGIKDYAYLFNCKEKEIALTQKAYKKNPLIYKVLLDDLSLDELSSAKDLKLPKYIKGSLSLEGLTSIEGLELPKMITENLSLDGLTSAKGLILPKSVGGSLSLNGLTNAEGLILPHVIGEGLSLDGLIEAKGLKFPKIIEGYLSLGGLTSAKGLILPEIVGEFLSLNGLTSAKDLILPQTIGGGLSLNGLTSAKDLILPQTIGGGLSLNGLTSAKDLILPQEIGGYLSLDGLTTIECLTLPETIGGLLSLDKLTSAQGLIFPINIDAHIYLRSLSTSEGLELPDHFNLDNFHCPYYIKQELIEKRNKGIHRK